MNSKKLVILGSVLLAIPFLLSGINKITGFSGVVGYAQNFGVPLTSLAIVLALIIEIVGALMLVFGFKVRVTSLVLAGYLVIVTLFFHLNFSDPNQIVQLNKNLGIIGGLLILSVLKKG